MRVSSKTTDWARKIDAVYPEELSARLQWWSDVLGLDRPRLLRMIGLSARQAAERKDQDLKDILQSADWEANAQLVEGGLLRLLSLFHYDWQALAERIHGMSVATEGEKPTRVPGRKGEGKRDRSIPNGVDADLLISRIADGGPQLLSALLAYLVASQANPGQAEW
jgi:hypothetical protein